MARQQLPIRVLGSRRSSLLRRCVATCTGILAPASVCGAQPVWVAQLGTSAADEAYAVAGLPSGAAYIAGATTGSWFGPSSGSADAFVAKFDAGGQLLWGVQFGTPTYDQVRAAAPDDAGGVFVAGTTSGNLGGPALGSIDIFLARYAPDGSLVWLRQFGTAEDDEAYALAPDGSGGVYVAASTGGVLGSVSHGGFDAVLARVSSDGELLWVRQIGTSDADAALGVCVTDSGRVYVCGGTFGSLGGSNAGGQDAWIASFDPDGAQLWVRQFGTAFYWDFASAATPDGEGGVYIGGAHLHPTHAWTYPWLARYDAAGNQVWLRQESVATSVEGDVTGLAADWVGGVFVAGTARFGVFPMPVQRRIFATRFNAQGVRTWSDDFGDGLNNSGYGAAIAGTGLVVVGSTAGNVGGTHFGSLDAVAARYAVCYPNCDGSTKPPVLNVSDFSCFLQKFAAAEPYANCDGSTAAPALNIADFSCFIQKFASGCD